MRMDPGLDTGPVLLATRRCRFSPEDTAGTLHDRLAASGHGSDRRSARASCLRDGSLVAYRKPAIGCLLRRQDHQSGRARRLVAACTKCCANDTGPESDPGRTDPARARRCSSSGRPKAHDTKTDQAPGTVLGVDADGIHVACGNGVLIVTELQRAGAKRLACPRVCAWIRDSRRRASVLEPDRGTTMSIVQRLATEAVAAVLAGRSLTPTLESILVAIRELAPADRSALWDLTHGTLRHLGLLRAIVHQIAAPAAQGAGLGGASRRCALPARVHTRGAVCRCQRGGRVRRAAGLAVGEGDGECTAAALSARDASALIATARADRLGRYSYPHGGSKSCARSIRATGNKSSMPATGRRSLSLRVNLRRNTREAYLARLRRPRAGCASRAATTASCSTRALPVTRIPGFAEGLVSVQDLGAQRAVRVPGLGSGTARARCVRRARRQDRAHSRAVRCGPARARRRLASGSHSVDENLARLGLRAQVRCADASALAHLVGRQGIRPHHRRRAVHRFGHRAPPSRHQVAAARAGHRQRSRARARSCSMRMWRVLKPGGKLLFATCSIFREENRDQVDDFVGRHADARIAPLPVEEGQDVQLLPDDSHDGFYYALLERR